MSASFLLVVLIIAIGYSASGFLPLRYRMAKLSGYLQYGAIIQLGILCLGITAAASGLFRALFMSIVHEVEFNFWASLSLIEDNVVRFSFSLFIVLLLMQKAANRYYYEKKKEQLIYNIHREHRDELDMILVTNAESENLLLFILDTEKVYLGWVVNTPNPLADKEHQYIRILPLKSGYRDKERRIVFNTDYEAVYDMKTYSDDDGKVRIIQTKDFEKVIPRQSIKSVNIFNPDIFGSF